MLNFVSGCTAPWKGANRDVAAAGWASVTAKNPVPGGGLSDALAFTINQRRWGSRFWLPRRRLFNRRLVERGPACYRGGLSILQRRLNQVEGAREASLPTPPSFSSDISGF